MYMDRKHRFNVCILLAFSALAFFFYNYINFFAPRMFNSPDENANFVFIRQFAEHTSLRLAHAYDYGEWSEYIHPRSAFADFGDYILPVGFWGIIIFYGIIAKITGATSVVFITPLLAIALGWSLYVIWKNIFDERIAFYSTIVFFLHPVVWYYSARSLLPNITFVSLIGIGSAFLLNAPIAHLFKNKKELSNKKIISSDKQTSWWLDNVLGVSCICTALFIRPNEIMWIFPAALIILFAYRKHIPLKTFLLWVVVSSIFAVLFFLINNKMYGVASGGYIVSNSLPLTKWYQTMLPFGFDIKHIANSGYVYFVKMYWWLVLPSLIGILFFISEVRHKKIRKSAITYFVAFLISAAILFIYYGSNVDISFSLKTIGVAYSRYWLPIHILSLPFIFFGFKKLLSLQPENKLFAVFADVFIVVVLFLSPPLVFGGIDGLGAMKGQLAYMQEVRNNMLLITKPNSVIVTDREDKFFWPHRAVMVRFYDPAIGKAISGLLEKGFEIYYFTPRMSEAEAGKLNSYIEQFDFQATQVRSYKDHELFMFK